MRYNKTLFKVDVSNVETYCEVDKCTAVFSLKNKNKQRTKHYELVILIVCENVCKKWFGINCSYEINTVIFKNIYQEAWHIRFNKK